MENGQEDLKAIKEQSIRLIRRIDANYGEAYFEPEVNKLIRLTKFQRVILLSYLKRYDDLFDVDLGECTLPPVDISLKDEARPYHAKGLTFPVIHLEA